MTQIEKEAFFAQYWGQRVISYPDEIGGLRVVEGHHCNEKTYLQLKPLESITDEDAIECIGKELYEFNRDNENDGYFGFSASGMFLDMIEFYKNDRSSADFLRSKGYLLPFRQYSTEQLIESGIAKI